MHVRDSGGRRWQDQGLREPVGEALSVACVPRVCGRLPPLIATV